MNPFNPGDVVEVIDTKLCTATGLSVDLKLGELYTVVVSYPEGVALHKNGNVLYYNWRFKLHTSLVEDHEIIL